MNPILIRFDAHQNLRIETNFSDKAANFCLGLLHVGFGKVYKVQNITRLTAQKIHIEQKDFSPFIKTAAKIGAVVLFPLTLIGWIFLEFSKGHSQFIRILAQEPQEWQEPEFPISNPLAHLNLIDLKTKTAPEPKSKAYHLYAPDLAVNPERERKIRDQVTKAMDFPKNRRLPALDLAITPSSQPKAKGSRLEGFNLPIEKEVLRSEEAKLFNKGKILQLLPKEIWFQILSQLPIKDFRSFFLSCHEGFDISKLYVATKIRQITNFAEQLNPQIEALTEGKYNLTERSFTVGGYSQKFKSTQKQDRI